MEVKACLHDRLEGSYLHFLVTDVFFETSKMIDLQALRERNDCCTALV